MRKVLICIISALLCFMLVSCSGGINEEALSLLDGDYNVEDSWWHLSISSEEKYFSIYDHEAGNPGVEGEITALDESSITIKIDPDYYDCLPGDDWECDGVTLTVEYEKTDDGIILTNNGQELRFVNE